MILCGEGEGEFLHNFYLIDFCYWFLKGKLYFLALLWAYFDVSCAIQSNLNYLNQVCSKHFKFQFQNLIKIWFFKVKSGNFHIRFFALEWLFMQIWEIAQLTLKSVLLFHCSYKGLNEKSYINKTMWCIRIL